MFLEVEEPHDSQRILIHLIYGLNSMWWWLLSCQTTKRISDERVQVARRSFSLRDRALALDKARQALDHAAGYTHIHTYIHYTYICMHTSVEQRLAELHRVLVWWVAKPEAWQVVWRRGVVSWMLTVWLMGCCVYMVLQEV